MSFRLNSRDDAILGSIAEHQILTVRQITILHDRNTRAVRHRLRHLKREEFIRVDTLGIGKSRGRPEGLISLCESGVERLRKIGMLAPDFSAEQATAQGLSSIPHQLLTNDFRVQLVQMEQLIPVVTTRFFSPTSPFLAGSGTNSLSVRERVEVDATTGRCIEFIPDGVFALAHAEAGKTLLFYLEVDMGTEPLSNRRRQGQDVRHKIENYQLLYRLQGHRHYEKVVGAALRGFRLLILADNERVMNAICRLVRDLGAPDFILMADRQRMESHGLWAEIWIPGGRLDMDPISILGSKMPRPAPSPTEAA